MLLENEKKFLVKFDSRKQVWDKEHLVYQWYKENSNKGSVKEKLIFDLKKCSIIYVNITKKILELGKSEKKVEYLDLNTFSVDKMLGMPFILKRRVIKDGIFVDRFIRSNGLCKYMVEIEDNSEEVLEQYGIKIMDNVTNDFNYYNQNMCILFDLKDAEYLQFLLNVFLLN